jgi:hypothetical protein
MTKKPPAPPLPAPPTPIEAARVLSRAAQAAACAWMQPLDPGGRNRAIRQIRSVLRDLGIATRGLARYQVTGEGAEGHLPGEPVFQRQLAAASSSLLEASQRLDDIPLAVGGRNLACDDEPGVVLCQAARRVFPAWRQPSGTAACRSEAARLLMAAVADLALALRALADSAEQPLTGQLRAARAHLRNVNDRLAEALCADAARPRSDARPGKPRGRGDPG